VLNARTTPLTVEPGPVPAPALVVPDAESSTSPAQSVLARGRGDYCGHCVVCNAYGDDATEDAAWLWVGEHRCGVETARPLPAPDGQSDQCASPR
jgi:hypothetical protein